MSNNSSLSILGIQLNYIVGDLNGNTQKIINAINTHGNNYDLLIFTELAISGYPPLDLLDKPEFVPQQLIQLERICAQTQAKRCSVIVGFIAENTSGVGKPFYNALVVIENGKISYQYNKQLLPTYNIFDESRHFESGASVGFYSLKGLNVGLMICEDAWSELADDNFRRYLVNPLIELKKLKLDLMISINASPSEINKERQRIQLVSQIGQELHAPVIYMNQVGANDDLVFDGGSFAVNNDGQLLRAKSFSEDYFKLSFSNGNLSSEDTVIYQHVKSYASFSAPEFIYQQVVSGIRDYVNKIACPGVVIGESGGIDSALLTALAVDALGAERVVAITMPSSVSSEGSWRDSAELCHNLGVKLYTHPIQELVDSYRRGFENSLGSIKNSLTIENIQARIRGNILMEYSNDSGYLVLSTSNKSEAAVGYTTLYGDMSGGLAPLSDVYKTEVWEVARYYNQLHFPVRQINLIPLAIIDKEPSAELASGQKDSDSLPEYHVLDAVLKYYLEGDLLSVAERYNLRDYITQHLSDQQILAIYALVDRAEFKRRQAPPTIRLHSRAWGAGRRLPIVQKYKPDSWR